MKPRKTLSIYVLLVGVMGLSIVGGILAFQIFSASVKDQLTPDLRNAVKPIDGTISQTVINNLQQRKTISETDLTSLSVPVPTTVPVQITTTPIATQSASPIGIQLTPTP